MAEHYANPFADVIVSCVASIRRKGTPFQNSRLSSAVANCIQLSHVMIRLRTGCAQTGAEPPGRGARAIWCGIFTTSCSIDSRQTPSTSPSSTEALFLSVRL